MFSCISHVCNHSAFSFPSLCVLGWVCRLCYSLQPQHTFQKPSPESWSAKQKPWLYSRDKYPAKNHSTQTRKSRTQLVEFLNYSDDYPTDHPISWKLLIQMQFLEVHWGETSQFQLFFFSALVSLSLSVHLLSIFREIPKICYRNVTLSCCPMLLKAYFNTFSATSNRYGEGWENWSLAIL